MFSNNLLPPSPPQTQVEDHEREVARLVKLLEQERKEKEEEAEVFHKKVNQAGF